MLKRLSLFALGLLAVALPSSATHLIGGEMNYEALNDSTYVVKLRIFRDCFGGAIGFDNPAYLFIYDGAGTYLSFVQLIAPAVTPVPATGDNPCLSVPPGICVEEGFYQDTLILPPSPGGYDLVYQRCCRNGTIANIIDPGSTGSTYWEHIPGPDEISGLNSSPAFVNFPPVVICTDDPLNFDHSAIDLDGDSLVYELCAPYLGASDDCPRPAGPATIGFGCPEDPGPPPYSEVPWLGGFSGTFPLPATPVLSIDPNTGLLTGTATTPGQYVVGVCVKEYRNDTLINTHTRDVQFNVVECDPLVVASIPDFILDCEDRTVDLVNSSTGADSYSWDYGDPTSTMDTSSAFDPGGWTYPDTGIYIVTLIANPGFVCADTAYAEVNIFPTLIGGWQHRSGCSGTPVIFTDTSVSTGAGLIESWSWSFGDGMVSSEQDPMYQYVNGGTYTVQMIVTTDKGCIDTISRSIDVIPGPDALWEADTVCFGETMFFDNQSTISTGTLLLSYNWDFGDGTTSTDVDPEHDYTANGTYTVTLIAITDSGCEDTLTKDVYVGRTPVADAGLGDTVEFLTNVPLMGSGLGDYLWIPGVNLDDPTAQNPIFAAWESTEFILTITSADGCIDRDTVYIHVLPQEILEIPTAFSPNGDGVNDTYNLFWNDISELYEFSIYNRWGEQIFFTTDLEVGWDGMYKGKMQDVGTYVVVIRALGAEGSLINIRENVYLVR